MAFSLASLCALISLEYTPAAGTHSCQAPPIRPLSILLKLCYAPEIRGAVKYTFFMDSGWSAQANKFSKHENFQGNIRDTVIDFHDISSCGDKKIATDKVH